MTFPPCSYCKPTGTSHAYNCGGRCYTTPVRYAVSLNDAARSGTIVAEFATPAIRFDFVQRLMSASSHYRVDGTWQFEYFGGR